MRRSKRMTVSMGLMQLPQMKAGREPLLNQSSLIRYRLKLVFQKICSKKLIQTSQTMRTTLEVTKISDYVNFTLITFQWRELHLGGLRSKAASTLSKDLLPLNLWDFIVLAECIYSFGRVVVVIDYQWLLSTFYLDFLVENWLFLLNEIELVFQSLGKKTFKCIHH